MTEKRPILTLKRKKPPAAEVANPVTAPATVKHRKTLPPLEMKSRDQVPVAATERKKKKKKPQILRTLAPDEALSTLSTYWPALFSKSEIRLLALHIFADLHQRQIDRNLPFSGKQLRRCIKTYVLSPEYLHATKAGAVRYDINGQPAGQVTEKEQAWAVKQLARITAQEADGTVTQGPA
ncbi:ProQ/FINO family protein [Chimaeribacter arupi]|uniref:ProQ/FINO family protein n=1 Tax=Chimaeribacter arupi TaxID=2060066 RepID=UPI000C7C2DBD|nr:ProQ/FINO family protein [Chimaeribacter arupi]PLR29161.1 hypothetical protein CYR23_21340 [Chimaeribacter arupi]